MYKKKKRNKLFHELNVMNVMMFCDDEVFHEGKNVFFKDQLIRL